MESVDKYRNLLKQRGVVLGSFSQNNNMYLKDVFPQNRKTIHPFNSKQKIILSKNI